MIYLSALISMFLLAIWCLIIINSTLHLQISTSVRSVDRGVPQFVSTHRGATTVIVNRATGSTTIILLVSVRHPIWSRELIPKYCMPDRMISLHLSLDSEIFSCVCHTGCGGSCNWKESDMLLDHVTSSRRSRAECAYQYRVRVHCLIDLVCLSVSVE